MVEDYPFPETFQIELLQGFHPFESPRACSSDIPISVWNSREFQLVAPEWILSEIARVFKWGSTGKAASVTQISLTITVLKLILACFCLLCLLAAWPVVVGSSHFPRTGMTGNCELLHVGGRNWTLVLCKSSMSFPELSHLSAAQTYSSGPGDDFLFPLSLTAYYLRWLLSRWFLPGSERSGLRCYFFLVLLSMLHSQFARLPYWKPVCFDASNLSPETAVSGCEN